MAREGGVFLPQKYKKYRATCTQATTAAPAEGTVIENTFDGTMTLARTGTGVYTFTQTGAFSTTKTICRVTSMGAAARIFSYAITSADVITITTFDAATPSAADSGNFYIEIETV